MKGLWGAGCLGLGLLLASLAGPLNAQGVGYINPAKRPAVSPYNNLIRAGTDPAINYYGLVRPEIAFRNAIQQLDQEQANLYQQQQQDLATYNALPPTGQGAGFMTQSKYFMTGGARGG